MLRAAIELENQGKNRPERSCYYSNSVTAISDRQLSVIDSYEFDGRCASRIFFLSAPGMKMERAGQ